MSDTKTAKIILTQLGGGKFVAMTGAKKFGWAENSLFFRLPGGGGYCRDGINAVRITLNSMDVYDVDYIRIRGTVIKIVNQAKGIYADMLRGSFETATGLATSL